MCKHRAYNSCEGGIKRGWLEKLQIRLNNLENAKKTKKYNGENDNNYFFHAVGKSILVNSYIPHNFERSKFHLRILATFRVTLATWSHPKSMRSAHKNCLQFRPSSIGENIVL